MSDDPSTGEADDSPAAESADAPAAESADAPVVAFVCVRNAGRSRMAAAFAEREATRRGADVEVLTGGTAPADAVHAVVVGAMAEVDVDLADREPREITPAEIDRADYVLTMGCAAEDVCPTTWRGDARDWALDDPHGRPVEEVREIRDEIESRVADLFDELAAGSDGAAGDAGAAGAAGETGRADPTGRGEPEDG